MSKYIELAKFSERIKKHIKPDNLEEKALIEWCIDECIRQGHCMPTADVVEVVRCKDCKRFCKMDTSPSYDGKCLGYGYLVEANHYCSYGERSENGK